MYMSNPAKKSSCESQIEILLQKFVSLGRISARSAELVRKQYYQFFIVIDQNQQLFSSLNPTNDRADILFSEHWQSYGSEFFVTLALFFFVFLADIDNKDGFLSHF